MNLQGNAMCMKCKNLWLKREALKQNSSEGNFPGFTLMVKGSETCAILCWESDWVRVSEDCDREMLNVSLPLSGQLEKLYSGPLHTINHHYIQKIAG